MIRHPASFRDTNSYVFSNEGKIFRNFYPQSYEDFSLFIKSGLYEALYERQWITAYSDYPLIQDESNKVTQTIQHPTLPFISYTYEWCFGQLKEAALLTLKIQRLALEHGMTLKDASYYNTQWHHNQMVFIDHGSFTPYEEGKPWAAYKQFCEHFLYPLALMHYTDHRLHQLLLLHPDGIDYSLTQKLLPFRAKCNPLLITHLYLHGKSIEKYQQSEQKISDSDKKISLNALKNLLSSLYDGINSFKQKKQPTQWQDYDTDTSYSKQAADSKKTIVNDWFEEISPDKLLDLGANKGHYTRLSKAAHIIACDMDHNAVQTQYEYLKSFPDHSTIHPLIVNLLQPTPSIGWHNIERDSFIDRITHYKPTCILSLALIHHLAITGFIPMEQLAIFYRDISHKYLILEWVPTEDPQTKRLINSRHEQFLAYNKKNLLNHFQPYFRCVKESSIEDSTRSLLLFEKL